MEGWDRGSLCPQFPLWLASPSDWQEEQGGQQGDAEVGLTTGLHVPRRSKLGYAACFS